MTTISVCICTFRRPDYLKRLLEGMGRQHTEGLFNYEIVVADNDRSQSAKSVCDAMAPTMPVKIIYCVEPEQNIARARNRALQHATGDYIAFFDDDQFPIDDWLLILYKTCNAHNVDGVLGPVKPHYEQPPPSWVVKGKFYDRPDYKTGFVIDWRKGRTGNVLLRKRVFEGMVEVFRPEFLTGEDQDFFRRAIENGYEFIWCSEAIAYETVPPLRWKRSFMLRRALLRGKVSIRHRGVKGISVAKSIIAVPLYSVSLPFALLFGQHIFMKHLVSLCDHAGRLSACVGIDLVKESYVTQ